MYLAAFEVDLTICKLVLWEVLAERLHQCGWLGIWQSKEHMLLHFSSFSHVCVDRMKSRTTDICTKTASIDRLVSLRASGPRTPHRLVKDRAQAGTD